MIELPNGRMIGPDEPCYLVAEIGQNHQGDVYTALRTIAMAQAASDDAVNQLKEQGIDAPGLDAVKLCKRHIPSDLTREFFASPYGGPNSFGQTYGQHRQALEMTIDEYVHLAERIRYNSWPLTLFMTACDIVSVDQLEEKLDPPLYKVASRDLENIPLLERIARTGKPVILSTGFCDCTQDTGLRCVQDAMDVFRQRLIPPTVVVLYCVSQYPTPDSSVSFRVMRELHKIADRIGFSDHTVGLHMAQTAVALGAIMIEKHITLSRALPGSDHAASLERPGLTKLIRNIRATEHAMRNTGPSPDVSEARKKLGRSVVAKRDILPGEVITTDMLCLKSPGNGASWNLRGQFIGKTALERIAADTLLHLDQVSSNPPKGLGDKPPMGMFAYGP